MQEACRRVARTVVKPYQAAKREALVSLLWWAIGILQNIQRNEKRMKLNDPLAFWSRGVLYSFGDEESKVDQDLGKCR
jgi:hypothetical protein